ncbi:MAG TPA: peptidoglycan-associated lipoprotein Pal [Steroidobacteraceae bacterium]|jgi:peptidoglycan-associated lipoprotein|nr:peptidoglycan-associated lipoprotein Pal [Steroidobacteraceae bacterium]
MRKILSVMLLASVMALVACAHKPPKDTGASASSQVPAAGAQANGAGANGAVGAGGANAAGGEDIGGPTEGILAQRTIYFAFDSSDINPEGTALISAHAHYLVAHSNLHVRLEGNTDERGSREYNIGLGERRAQAVRRAMLLQGVAETQLSTVSYGAERPAVEGHDESAWSKNRRVVINYVQ